jgi:hypothetical protein
MSFADLKRSSSTSFEKLNKELSKLNSSNERKNDDENYWKPEVDKAGNGYAVLRFLPAPENEDFPFVRVFDHGFQGPTGLWYIEKSLTTIGQDDPVGEHNSKLWNSGIDADKEIARKQKRRLSYISNVLVVKDPANPANEGKVFLYKYGKKIFDKLNDLMNPQFEDEDPVNPFDLWKGANFKLKIRQVDGYRNYDKSEFDTPAPLFDDDDKLEATWKKEFSLQTLVDPKHFKSYSELKTRLDTVLSLTGSALRPATRDETTPSRNEDKAPAMAAPAPKAAEAKAPAVVDDDDEDLEFFKRLAEED